MEPAEHIEENAHLETQKDMYLTFHVEGEDYAVDIKYISEIIGMQEITEVPEMPSHIKGMINLRGKVIPVMDIRARFDLPDKPYSDRTCIIVTEVSGLLVGIVVDTVKEVTYISPDKIEPASPCSNAEANYVKALAKLEDGVKIILAMENVVDKDAGVCPEESSE